MQELRRKIAQNPALSIAEGRLLLSGADVCALAGRYGTPLYVLSAERVKDNYRRLEKAFKQHYGRVRIHYACKANSGIALLKLLRPLGAHVDAVSAGEVYLARRAGFEAGRIVYTGTSVSNEELEYLVREGVAINLDSLSQMRRLAERSSNHPVSFRINPGVGAGHHAHVRTGDAESKFGVPAQEAAAAYEEALSLGLKPVGIHMHIGSGIMEAAPFVKALSRLLETARRVAALGVRLEFIDMGGGLGIPYKPAEKPIDIDAFSARILGLFKEKIAEHSLGQPAFALEPGRYIAADAELLAVRVNTIKKMPRKTFAGVDAGFNTLVRPAMYDSYHLVAAANKADEKAAAKYDIAGNVCESGDVFARERMLPLLKEGDVLAILDAGAYGFSMASEYNSRPLPAEVLVERGKARVVRRRGTLEELLRNQEDC
jgi:diaminopimelate decarboxylase